MTVENRCLDEDGHPAHVGWDPCGRCRTIRNDEDRAAFEVEKSGMLAATYRLMSMNTDSNMNTYTPTGSQ